MISNSSTMLSAVIITLKPSALTQQRQLLEVVFDALKMEALRLEQFQEQTKDARFTTGHANIQAKALESYH